MLETRIEFKVHLLGKKAERKICTLCYDTGYITQPNGLKVPCPKGCLGFYLSHRWEVY